jgi:hypothetical protein
MIHATIYGLVINYKGVVPLPEITTWVSERPFDTMAEAYRMAKATGRNAAAYSVPLFAMVVCSREEGTIILDRRDCFRPDRDL